MKGQKMDNHIYQMLASTQQFIFAWLKSSHDTLQEIHNEEFQQETDKLFEVAQEALTKTRNPVQGLFLGLSIAYTSITALLNAYTQRQANKN
jgi:hypothetical protein